MTTIAPSYPSEFKFYYPVSVRVADLDTQRHVNNVKILEYIESARTAYYQVSGIWDGETVQNFGMVVASIKIDYIESIVFGQSVRVGICLSHLGGKSLRFRFQVEDGAGEKIFARGETVMVSYDHQEGHSRLVPEDWRKKLAAFEGREDLA